MKLVKQIVTWQVPVNPSVVKHKIYYSVEVLTYDSPFVEVPMPTCEYDVATLPVEATGEVYNLGLVAVDGIGNESSMALREYPLANLPPATPIWIL